mmetsp:Transcript_12492/g.28961  ORF Transcript_12492/g.28961 Transcript_12492/m.28961 type:complete len:181 (+) Transcript_12492:549-1091(+)
MIYVPEDQANLFPKPFDDSFYVLVRAEGASDGPSVPTLRMVTRAGMLCSGDLFVHVFEGKNFVNAVLCGMDIHGADCVSVAKEAARSIFDECGGEKPCSLTDRRVLLLRGLPPAIDNIAKRAGYRVETWTVVDLVIANLMLERHLVVLQAVRLKNETELVLQQLALSCFHYHLLTNEIPR